MTTLTKTNSIHRSPLRRGLLLIPLAFVCFGLAPASQAVLPAPDGGYPGGNTAEGLDALLNLSTGVDNTAIGRQALRSNTDGVDNTATGFQALLSNTGGSFNTATGVGALFANMGGAFSSGKFNTAYGWHALVHNTTGFENTAFGINAGSQITTGSGNICIGAGVGGVAGENNITRIGNISSTAQNSGVYVTMDQINGTKLGYVVMVSSRRYKEDVKPIDKASEALLALKPVRFRYKADIDPDRAERFGLIAEEVEKVNPDLVVRDQNGKANVVRYDSINAMLLNEFLKQHRKVEQQDATIAKQKQIEALTAGLQKVSDQLELSKPAPRTVLNNQ
jgi:hypothetical protein